MSSEDQVVFLNKLGEIPVINDGWSTAAEYYSKVKDYNSLMHLTLSMAESSVKVASNLSAPVLNRYQSQIDTINEFACQKLEELEEKYPVIKQPTDQLKETCVDYAEPVIARVKPVISQVNGMVDNGKQKIANVKKASTDMIEGAKNMGVGTVTHVINTTFETAPGRFVTRTADSVLDIAENLVDKYLPEEKEINDDEDDESSNGAADTVEEMQVMDPTPKRVVMHAGCVTEKLRKRMFRLAMKDLTYAKARTSFAISQLQSTVTLIDLAKRNITTAKDKVDNMWTEIVKETESAEEKTVFVGSIEDRIVALGRLAASQVRSGVTAFEKASSELGQLTKDPISKSKEYRDLIQTFLTTESIKNFTSESLTKAKESLTFIQDKLQMIIKNSTSFSWMAVDIDAMVLNENDIGMEQVVSTNNNSDNELEREERH